MTNPNDDPGSANPNLGLGSEIEDLLQRQITDVHLFWRNRGFEDGLTYHGLTYLKVVTRTKAPIYPESLALGGFVACSDPQVRQAVARGHLAALDSYYRGYLRRPMPQMVNGSTVQQLAVEGSTTDPDSPKHHWRGILQVNASDDPSLGTVAVLMPHSMPHRPGGAPLPEVFVSGGPDLALVCNIVEQLLPAETGEASSSTADQIT